MKHSYPTRWWALRTRELLASLRLLALLPLLALASCVATVSTDAPAAITLTSARLGGNSTTGMNDVRARGVYYNNTGPASAGTRVQITGPGDGPFSQVVTGLMPGTTYNVAAFIDVFYSGLGGFIRPTFGTEMTFTTLAAATTAVVSVTRLSPSPTATAQVSYRVQFSQNVSGLSAANFSVTPTGSVSGAAVSSVSGSANIYTVVVNTGTGNGTLRLDVGNSTGTTPAISNVPFTTGDSYTLTRSFATAPQLSLVGGGSAAGNSDVTAFVDLVQVLQSGTGTPVANGLQNNSFETNNVPANSALYPPNVVAAPWTFASSAGVSRNGTGGFGSTAADGTAVAFLQGGGSGGSIAQNLVVPPGSYQVNFVAAQRTNQASDQLVNVFLVEGSTSVFMGSIRPTAGSAYQPFTSPVFSVTAPALTASITSTATNPTSTTPIPVAVTFSQSVGTTFTASDVTVGNGTLSGFAGSGTTYTFNITPGAAGPVTVNVAANVANDANNIGNAAVPPFSITYQPITAAPVVTAPANGGLTNTATPTYTGTAVAGSTVTVSVDGFAIGTTTATGGSFSLAQPTALPQGAHTVRATAQSSGEAVSANSNTNTFTVDTVSPTVALTSTTGATGGNTTTTPLAFTATFSEPVTGFAASGLTVTNGTVTSGPAGSGTTYTFSVTPTTAGTATTVTVAANAAQDAATNGNTGSNTYALTYAPASLVWNGSAGTDWFTAGNWTPALVPTSTVSVTIPAGTPNMPLITGTATATARNLTLNTGATFTQTGSGSTLVLTGNLTNNGTYAASGPAAGAGPTLSLGTTALANVLGSGSTRFWNLTVGANGAQLSTSASTSVQRILTLNGNLATNGNPLTLESDAANTALVVNNGGNVVSGNVTVQRYIDPILNPGPGYRHYSAPISNATVASLATAGFTPVVNPAYNTSPTPSLVRPFPTVYGYDQARVTITSDYSPFDRGFFSPNALSDALVVGKGYTVNLAAQTLAVTGSLNNGDVTQNLASTRTTDPNGGWHLLGNPYPAPLDYNQVVAADRLGLDAAIYVYQSAGPYVGQYRSYVSGVGNPVLPSGQAFFARVAAGQPNGTLTLRNSYRVTTANNTAFLRTAAETRPLVQLTLQGAAAGTASDEAYVYAQAGATVSYDGEYDAEKLPNPTGLNLSSAAAGRELAINGLPAFAPGTVVPLSVGVPAAGTYALGVAQLLNLPAGTAAVLVDAQLGTQTDLAALPAAGYAFTVTATQARALLRGRFFLNLMPAGAPLATAGGSAAQPLALFPNPAAPATTTLTGAVAGAKVTVMDAVGRTVLVATADATGTARLVLPAGLASGVYVVRTGTRALRLTVE